MPIPATKIKIESLGVYLPPKVMTTEELMQKCVSRPRLDLEKFTGVEARRVLGDAFLKLIRDDIVANRKLIQESGITPE